MANVHIPEVDFHVFSPTQIKTICSVCGYGIDAPHHAVVIDDSPESRELSGRLAVEQELRNHDAEVILKFKYWMGALGTTYISKADLIRFIDGYAQAIQLGNLK